MGAYVDFEDEQYCASPRKSGMLSGIPNWVALAGGIALGKMLGRSSSSSSLKLSDSVDQQVIHISSLSRRIFTDAMVSASENAGNAENVIYIYIQRKNPPYTSLEISHQNSNERLIP